MSLQKKMASGAIWALLEKVGQQGLSFLVFMVLARIVGPEEFGLVNICYVYMTFSYFLIFGLLDGIVSLQIHDTRRRSTMFWFIMGIGALLSLLGLAFAGLFADFMEQPRLENIVYWMALIPPLMAAYGVPYMVVMQAMDFKIYALRSIVANIAGGATGIIMALQGYGAYALIAQQIVMYSVTNMIIWPSCKWVPAFEFDRPSLKAIIAPGLRMSGSSFVEVFDQQAPRIIIGSLLGPIAVGHYSLVIRMRQALYDVLIHPLAVVLYPAFSSIKNDTKEQERILGQIIAATGVLIFPTIGGAIATAPIYVPLFFGKDWIAVIPVLQILLISGGLLPFIIIMRDVLRAHNCTGAYLKAQILLVVCNFALAFVLAPQGLSIYSVGIVAAMLLTVPAIIYQVRKRTGVNLWADFAKLAPPLFSTIIMVAAIYGFNQIAIVPEQPAIRLIGSVLVGGIVYTALAFLLMKQQVKFATDMVKKVRQRRANRGKTMETTSAETNSPE